SACAAPATRMDAAVAADANFQSAMLFPMLNRVVSKLFPRPAISIYDTANYDVTYLITRQYNESSANWLEPE
ncbi:MAG: hypothetical protein AAF503_06980, partial [Pseudomonadota bacterium]